MAGLYIHIPFCKTRCFYCDFFSSTNLRFKESFIKALCVEMETEKMYVAGESIETIYFGGGTPSLFTPDDIALILTSVHKHFKIIPNAEVTLEANPDDCSIDYLKNLKAIGFNRISIGVQSLNDLELKLLNRRHTGKQALQSISLARSAGFNNLSIDLIFGIPGQTTQGLEKQISLLGDLNPEHISAYHLSVEAGTQLHNFVSSGKIKLGSDENSANLYKAVCGALEKLGYNHYEISNFSIPSFHSRHNSNYWKGRQYLGLGPSAHSFNGVSRKWNHADLKVYIEKASQGLPCYSKEILSTADLYNESVMLGLRTSAGVDLKQIKNNFGLKFFDFLVKKAMPFVESGVLAINFDNLTMSEEGWFISDSVISRLFIEH